MNKRLDRIKSGGDKRGIRIEEAHWILRHQRELTLISLNCLSTFDNNNLPKYFLHASIKTQENKKMREIETHVTRV